VPVNEIKLPLLLKSVARSVEDEHAEDDGALTTEELAAALLAAPSGAVPPSPDELAGTVDDPSCYEEKVAAIQTALSEMTPMEQLGVASDVLKDLSDQQMLAKVMGEEAAVPKKRGRPPGARNKVKAAPNRSGDAAPLWWCCYALRCC
jgi:hypothetical protein